jgi:hypothetical protein
MTVEDIRVSTVAPWAVATVTFYQKGVSQPVQAVVSTFHRDHGRWTDASSVNTPDRVVPKAVQEDLGLTGSGSNFFEGPYVVIYLLACWFFGLAGVIDVVLQPRRAFRAAGHSKLRWFLIEVVGVLLVGVFTWALYAIWIRPRVVRAGGRPPRQLLKALAASSAADNSAASSRRQDQANRAHKPYSPPPGKCPNCDGTGRVKLNCSHCGNRGQVPQPNPYASYQGMVGCPACGAAVGGRTQPCTYCHGSGQGS